MRYNNKITALLLVLAMSSVALAQGQHLAREDKPDRKDSNLLKAAAVVVGLIAIGDHKGGGYIQLFIDSAAGSDFHKQYVSYLALIGKDILPNSHATAVGLRNRTFFALTMDRDTDAYGFNNADSPPKCTKIPRRQCNILSIILAACRKR